MQECFPNLIIGGAPKCGTSSLYFWLSAHPEVFGSPKKETSFFADKVNRFNAAANVHEHQLDAYLQFFKDAGDAKIRFEATAHYLYEEQALKAFSEAAVPPKMIFLFREPSKQMYSHYKMEKYRTKRVNMALEDYIKLPKIDMYVDYATYLKKWVDAMPEGHVRIWSFEDFMSRKVEVMQDIADYLGIDPSFYTDFDFEHRNESVVIRSSALHQLGLRLQPLIPHFLQKMLLPVYMKLNSGGRAPDNEADAPVISAFKNAHAHVGADLKALFPDIRLEKWG
jgi:hypothetical protein